MTTVIVNKAFDNIWYYKLYVKLCRFFYKSGAAIDYFRDGKSWQFYRSGGVTINFNNFFNRAWFLNISNIEKTGGLKKPKNE